MRRKWVAFATTVLMTFVFAGQAVVQASTSPTPHNAGHTITPADRKAAAARAKANGVTPRAALPATGTAPKLALAAPNSTPDYFGNTPNYANSPLPPAITISGGGGSGATAVATVIGGQVFAVTVTTPGTGYTSAPSVTFASLDGSGAAATAAIAAGAVSAIAVTNPGSGYGGIRKFVDSLPGLGSAGANDLGQYIPVAVPDTTSFPGADYYVIELGQYSEQLNKDLPSTLLRGYHQVDTGVAGIDSRYSYLGPTIIAQKDRPVRVKFINSLPPGSDGNLFLPVDTTVMGAGEGPLGPSAGNYLQNRATLHLHGGNTPWISDGTEDQWITPAGASTAYPKGVSAMNVPDMADPGPGAQTFYYTNQQSARLMFYHDHALGITRLNVYAGEAAGYVLRDSAEQNLIANGTIPATELPLIIQDKTFVPGPTQLAAQDPTWAYGSTGQLWFPHVYMPNQNPADMSGANAMGRWDYGPWFWPPFTGIANGPVPNPLFGTTPMEGPVNPGTPNPSIVPEGFMDTPLVNGTAYPFVQVGQQAYRFRILNASNDRTLNLQLYYAKSNGDLWTVDAQGKKVLNDANAGEVPMVAAVQTAGYPATCPSTIGAGTACWPTDGRVGGVPDPKAAGPSMIQIGTDGGFLPQAVTLTNQPVNYIYNRRDITVLNVNDKTLFLGPAERADVIVDFSQVPAGSKLILYNDSPAPVPAFDPRYDYYTGDPNQVDTGGAPTTLPGYGPNTRTIMQFQVGQAALGSTTLTNGGAGFTKPVVGFTGGGGTGAAAMATGTVDKVVLTPGGSYTTPTVSFTGGGTPTASAAATVSGTVNATATVTAPGVGYTQPVATLSGGGGTGATATATGAVDAVSVPNSYASTTLANAPTGYWRLGDTGGTTAADASGHGNTGTLTGSVTEGATGLIIGPDTAMTFNGPFGSINVGNAASLQSSAGTLEAWVKTTAIPPAGSPYWGFMGILVKQYAYGIFENATGNLVAYDWTTNTIMDSGIAINDGLRHHVVLTYQSGVAGGSQLYLDGVAVGAPFTYTVSAQSSAMAIGAGTSSGYQAFTGTIDEAAFYPIVLSAAQVMKHYNAGITNLGPSGYTQPVVTFSSGAAAATASGTVSVAVTNAGTLYTNPLVVNITGGTLITAGGIPGRPATATATADSSGAVTVTVTDPGTGYTSAPTVNITDSPPGTGTGFSAKATLTLNAITITDGGSGYSTAPAATMSDTLPGTGPTVATTSTLKVTAVSVANPGAGYTSAPSVAFADTTGGTGTGAAAVATLSLTALNLTSGGAGYSFAPTVVIAGGTGATATATLKLTGLTLTNPGSGYSSAPTVTITDTPPGTGTGATGTATLSTALGTAFNVTKLMAAMPGAYATFQAPPIVPQANYNTAFNQTGPVDAYARIQDTSMSFFNGPLSGLAIVRSGTYLTAPAVTISAPPLPGIGATATATLGATVSSVTLLLGGRGFTAPPTVTFTGGGGTGATATSALAPTRLASIRVTAAGRGYTSAPQVNISGGGGSGAAAVATVSRAGGVTGIRVTNGGAGYTSTPTITLSGGGGTGATAADALAPVSVASLTLTNGGSGYTSAPTVTITPIGAGTGATASATIGPFGIASLTLTNAGTGYTSAPTVTIAGGAIAVALGVTINFQPKSIIEDFDASYGRMNAMLGVEIPLTTALTNTAIPFYDTDPATEIIKASDAATSIGTLADGTQIWKITHNGVDTHAIHWHMFNVQVINRVGWDGAVRPPDANELGWKDTVRMSPLEDVIVALRPILPNLPPLPVWDLPNSIRALDVTAPIGSAMPNEFHNTDPINEPATVTNQLVNFGWEYVWHCHLLGHEENIMMRPMIIGVAPKPATNLTATVTTSSGTTATITLTWSDNSHNETGFTVQRATTAGGPWTTIATGVPGAATGTGPVSYIDTAARHTTYYYQVIANNLVGYTQAYAPPALGYPHQSFDSAASTSATVSTP
jgi:FtsP/CotA-like multicopper oxidase with cupredoxin domain